MSKLEAVPAGAETFFALRLRSSIVFLASNSSARILSISSLFDAMRFIESANAAESRRCLPGVASTSWILFLSVSVSLSRSNIFFPSIAAFSASSLFFALREAISASKAEVSVELARPPPDATAGLLLTRVGAEDRGDEDVSESIFAFLAFSSFDFFSSLSLFIFAFLSFHDIGAVFFCAAGLGSEGGAGLGAVGFGGASDVAGGFMAGLPND
mmetsp:Transcript_4198/g.8459  ORF Transcript_4198/g.8459 Transcript_4198/m.8459 type:complete len:213 (-) Transcript_4198:358-996(-)